MRIRIYIAHYFHRIIIVSFFVGLNLVVGFLGISRRKLLLEVLFLSEECTNGDTNWTYPIRPITYGLDIPILRCVLSKKLLGTA